MAAEVPQPRESQLAPFPPPGYRRQGCLLLEDPPETWTPAGHQALYRGDGGDGVHPEEVRRLAETNLDASKGRIMVTFPQSGIRVEAQIDPPADGGDGGGDGGGRDDDDDDDGKKPDGRRKKRAAPKTYSATARKLVKNSKTSKPVHPKPIYKESPNSSEDQVDKVRLPYLAPCLAPDPKVPSFLL